MERRARVLVDAAAARVGGGVSRLTEFNAALSVVAPQHEYVFAVTSDMASRLRQWASDSEVVVVPRALRSVLGRLVWENVYLPRFAVTTGVSHILAPFGVLPMWPGLGSVRKAVVVSNIGPFAPEVVRRLHGYQAARNRVLRTLMVMSLKTSDHVFILSNAARDLMGPALRGKPTTLLPMSPPHPGLIRAAEEFKLPGSVSHGPFFGAFGDLLPYKGFEDAIRAIDHLHTLGREATLLICGNPIDKAYANHLKALADGSSNAVRMWTGRQQADVLGLMRHSVATIVSSRVENPGRVPVEAMAMGSAIVSADVPVTRESCADAALYYRPGDHRELAAHLARLMDQPDERDRLAARGRARIGARDWTAATRVLLSTLGLA